MNPSVWAGRVVGAAFVGTLVLAAFLLGTSIKDRQASPGISVQSTRSTASSTSPPCRREDVNTAAKGSVRLENSEGSGSGFLISDELVITAKHVVSRSNGVDVQFADGSPGRGNVT